MNPFWSGRAPAFQGFAGVKMCRVRVLPTIRKQQQQQRCQLSCNRPPYMACISCCFWLQSFLPLNACPGHVHRISGLHVQQSLLRAIMPEQRQQQVLHALCVGLNRRDTSQGGGSKPSWCSHQRCCVLLREVRQPMPPVLQCTAMRRQALLRTVAGARWCKQQQAMHCRRPAPATQPAAGSCLLRFAPTLPEACLLCALLCCVVVIQHAVRALLLLVHPCSN